MKCERCGGLKIAERFYGADATVPAWVCDGYRCVNCGHIAFVRYSPPGRTTTLVVMEEHS